MRFLTYEHENKQFAGVINDENKIFSFECLMGEGAPKTMIDYLRYQSTDKSFDLAKLMEDKEQPGVPIKNVKLNAPIPYPFRDIICLGKNYEDHAKELQETAIDKDPSKLVPVNPVYFSKNAYPAIGNGDFIPSHAKVTQQLDYEVELAVVIGKTCDNVKPEDAEDYIFGYTILNDVSARDIQIRHNQWYRGKSLDGFAPMGPWIVDKSQIKFPVELDLETRVNGEIRQHSNTKLFIFGLGYVISELSQGMKLYPGDIIATGTPGGVGHGFKPPKHLKPGDIVECEIEKIGILKNIVH